MSIGKVYNLRRYVKYIKLDLNVVRMEIIKEQVEGVLKMQKKASKYSHNSIRRFMN